MRHSRPVNRATWGPYVAQGLAEARKRRTTVVAIAEYVGVDRGTLYKWAREKQAPETIELVRRFGEAIGDDPAVAVRAAGMLDQGHEAYTPQELEPAIEIINKSSLPDLVKAEWIEEVLTQTEIDRQRRAEWVTRNLRLSGRTGLNKKDQPGSK